MAVAKKHLMFRNLFLISCFITAAFFKSQTTYPEHLSGFNMTSFTYKHDKTWSAYLELQERSIEDFSKPDYYEIKGGIGYNFNKNNQAFLGTGRYATYKNSKISNEELRLWLQYTYSFNLDKLKIDNRIRLEKRFFHNPITDVNSNDERYRFRITGTLPLNSDKMTPKTFFLNGFDEVFVGPNGDLFKRNRVFAGTGYVFNDYISGNLGYMWQRELYPTIKSLHFLYFGVNFTFDRLKYKEHHNIPVAD